MKPFFGVSYLDVTIAVRLNDESRLCVNLGFNEILKPANYAQVALEPARKNVRVVSSSRSASWRASRTQMPASMVSSVGFFVAKASVENSCLTGSGNRPRATEPVRG